MVGMLNATADGSLHGVRRLYALAHAARCEPCRRFLAALRGMIGNLRASKDDEPSAEVLERLRERARAAAERDS
jgi:anti-sigma factor ChrR (cupin superfamily)